jgi:hypothetical protein
MRSNAGMAIQTEGRPQLALWLLIPAFLFAWLLKMGLILSWNLSHVTSQNNEGLNGTIHYTGKSDTQSRHSVYTILCRLQCSQRTSGHDTLGDERQPLLFTRDPASEAIFMFWGFILTHRVMSFCMLPHPFQSFRSVFRILGSSGPPPPTSHRPDDRGTTVYTNTHIQW